MPAFGAIDSGIAEVLVALVSGMALIGVALVQTMRRATTTANRIGEPNGEGNVVQMLERILHGQTGQDVRLARLEHRANETVELVAGLEDRLAELEKRLN
jgi:hypothetical protein